MAHADGSNVQPILKETVPGDPRRTLTGFHFGSDECYANLSGDDMRRVGRKLVQVFCSALSKEDSEFEADAREGVLERAV